MPAQPAGHARIAACCGAFLLSCYVSVKGHTTLAISLTVLSVLLAGTAFALRGRLRPAASCLPALCFVFAASLLSLSHRVFVELPAYSLAGDGVRISAGVRDVRLSEYSMSVLLELKSADGAPARGRLWLEPDGFVKLDELDRVELTADVEVYPERDAPPLSGSPNRSRDIFLSASPSPGTDITVTPAPPSISLALKGMRDGIKGMLEERIWLEGDSPSPQAALASGIFLGERDGIHSAVTGAFNRAGISHILSVSGMHLTILIGTLFSVLCGFGLHRRAACVSAMAAALLYMALCGFVPSATRAGVMLLFYYTAMLFGRESDARSSLFMAGCAICAVNPYTAADVSFMLSFLATLGIVTASPLLSRVRSAMERRSRLLVLPAALVSGVGITSAAVFFTLPVTCSVFGTLSVVSPIANLAAAPFVQLIMVFSPLLALTHPLPFVPELLSAALYGSCDVLTSLALYLSGPDWATAAISYPGLAAVAAAGVLFAILPFYVRGKWRLAFALSLSLCVVIGGGIYVRGRTWDRSNTRIIYAAKGSGQQLILCGGQPGADIIDISDGSRSQLHAISRAMAENGDTYASSLTFACLHPGHPAFFGALLERMPVRTIYLPLSLYGERDAIIKERLEYLARSADCDIMYYTSDIEADSARLYISTVKTGGTVQTMAEADTGEMRVLYLTRGQPEAFSHELEGEYDGVILGTHGASLDGQNPLDLSPKRFALYTHYNYYGTSLAPKISSALRGHLTKGGLPLYNASGALYTRFTPDKGNIKVDMIY